LGQSTWIHPPTLTGVEVHFSREEEAQLSQIASHAGTDSERLVEDAALRLLEQDTRFRAAVRKHKVPPLRFAPVGMTELLREGVAQADREEFIEEEEVDARIERMVSS
jgi:hypothetical protein